MAGFAFGICTLGDGVAGLIIGMYPYLVFNGNGQEAVRFYEKTFEAQVVTLQTFGNMPENPEFPMPEEAKERVLNAHLKIGQNDLMVSDTFPGTSYQIGSQVTVALTVDNVQQSREIFGRLQEEGKVTMPLQETFWSPSYGQLTDRFGITWQITTQVD